MRAPDPAHELHPAAIADLISRLEDAACLLAWQLPEARDCEHYMALELGRLRALEAAAAIADLACRESRIAATDHLSRLAGYP